MKLFKIFILAFFVVSLIACGGAEERKAVYLEKAKASIEAGDLDKARIELKNVLQIDPKDSESYYQLGKIFEQQNEYQKAFSNYLKAETLNPELFQNQARLGRFYLLLANDHKKAQEKVDYILSKEPSNSDGLLLKAAVLLKENNINDAIIIAKNIVSHDSQHVESILFLSTLYLKENKTTEAINVLDNALKVGGNNIQLNKLLALALIKNKDYKRAELIYKMFLEKKPNNILSYNNLAAFYMQISDEEKAVETLRLSIENKPDDVSRILTLIKYTRATKGNDDAIKELRKFIVKYNTIAGLKIALAELFILNNEKELAIETYKEIIKSYSEETTGLAARISLASIYLRDSNFSYASELIEEAITVSPRDPRVNLIRAKLALIDKDVEKAIISLRMVIKETPENIDAYLLLANAYMVEGNKEQVRDVLNSAYESNKLNADNLLKLTQYYLPRDLEQSEKIIDSYNALKDSDYYGLSIKSNILNQQKKYLEAFEMASKLIDLYPDKPNGYLQSVAYLNESDDINKAISVLKKGYLNTKDNRKILLLLTTIEVSKKQFDTVVSRIKSEIKLTPDDPSLKILLSKVYMAQNDTGTAVSLLNEVVKDKPEIGDSYILLANIYQNDNNLSLLKASLERGKKNVPSSSKIKFMLAAVYEKEGEYQQAIDVYRELYQSSPDNLVVVNNLASLLSDYGDNEKDLKLAVNLADRLKESKQFVYMDTVGWVYYKIGDYQSAIKYLTQSAEKLPKVNVFNYHLGMAFKKSGDNIQAKIYLEKSLADGKNFKEKELAKSALKDL